MHRSFIFMTVVFNFSLLSTYWEEHIRMLEALCRIYGEKTKGNERKEDVTKYADEVKQIRNVTLNKNFRPATRGETNQISSRVSMLRTVFCCIWMGKSPVADDLAKR